MLSIAIIPVIAADAIPLKPDVSPATNKPLTSVSKEESNLIGQKQVDLLYDLKERKL